MVRQKFLQLGCALLIFAPIVALASPLADSPFAIPIENIRPEATDIIVDGVRLLPAQVAERRNRGEDISQLDPYATTDLWNPEGRFPKLPDDNSLKLMDGATVKFVDTIESPLKMFRFLAQDETDSDHLYQVFAAKRAQMYLLRRNLLRKLGYYIPPMKRLKKLRVEFANVTQRNNFINDPDRGLKLNALGDKEWVLNLDDKEAKHVDLQDVVLLPGRDQIANLALGVIRPDINQGRRIINALLVPFNLVDVRESVNGFRWHSAQIKSNVLYLSLEDEEGFSTTMADGRWIMRKILKLSRANWEAIVAEIGYPEPVQKLLVEKLISRRNEMRRLMGMSESEDLPYDSNKSFPPDLVDGDLQRYKYPGLAARMGFDELPSMISGAEMRGLFKSKAISTGISELVRRVNTDLIPRTDIAAVAEDRELDRFLDELVKFFKDGTKPSKKVGIWSVPYYGGQLIASREVIAGSYMGTDNRVQLVDTIGVGIETGLYFGTTKFGPKPFANAKGKITYFRTYAHLKPLTSVRGALKEPFKNILVPALKREWAGLIDPAKLVKPVLPTDPEESKKVQLQWESDLKGMVELLKENLQDGESLIITDNLTGGASILAGYHFSERVNVQAQFEAGLLGLGRLHIQRAGNEINVYKDFGNMRYLQLAISLRAGIEVLDMRGKLSSGSARTDLYHLDLNEKLKENPDLPLALSGIRDMLLKSNVKKIKLFQEAHHLEHQVKETSGGINFLFWNNFGLSTEDRLKLTRANEDQPEYYLRRLMGKRWGNDYQSFGVDLVNQIISETTKQPIKISNVTAGDPGDTLFGKSKARYSYFEAELDPENGFKESFVGVIYRWKGWTADKNRLQKIVKEFSDRFGFQFYHPQAMQQVKKAELYSMNLRIFIYDTGVWNLVYISLLDLKRILDQHMSIEGPDTYLAKKKNEIILSFYRLQQEYQDAMGKRDFNKAGDKALQLSSMIESSVDHNGLIEAVGGLKNVMIQPILTGFFRGEDGKMAEMPIEGNQIGQVGSIRYLGPMTTAQMEIGATESEFFVYWLIGRI